MGERCAVVGIGQTQYARCIPFSMEGLVRQAAQRALEDAELGFADIDAIVIGKAPDALEGVMMPELSLCDALVAVGKPIHRVHTAGSVGASTAISAATLVESGMYDTVLTVAYEKQSEGDFMWALSGGRSGGQGAGGSFAPWIREYIKRSGAPEHIGWKVAVKDRVNALKNPYAHLQMEDISVEKVKESPMLWDPLHFFEACPSSDGAAAMVITNAAGAKRAQRPVAWVLSHAKRTEFTVFPGRDAIKPAAGVECAKALYEKAGITDPRRQIDCAELYVPFSWFEPMWLEGHLICEEGEGWRMVDSGATEIGGDFPVNMSGGVLSSNPIGASG
ncbi:MAG: thiolase domain-containing protein, partial [Myxococcota bacterium]|nr:thiolase domain-containing protein [Myxococcota bacterium]